jgi:hypothetical protein
MKLAKNKQKSSEAQWGKLYYIVTQKKREPEDLLEGEEIRVFHRKISASQSPGHGGKGEGGRTASS